MRYLCLFLMLTTLALAEPLVVFEANGGLTPRGMGHSELRIQPDGKFEWYDQMADKWRSTAMSKADLEKLRQALRTTDYKAWAAQDPKATRPSAADGPDYTLTAGKHVLNLWQLKESEKVPLVVLVRKLQSTYQK